MGEDAHLLGAAGERRIVAQLRMADRGSARYAAILGERETESGVVTLRKLDDGTQEEVAQTGEGQTGEDAAAPEDGGATPAPAGEDG